MICLVRADAGAIIGTGHVMRCLALAQGWRARGGSVILASAALHPRLAERYDAEGVDVKEVSAEPGSPEDERQTIDLAGRVGASWVVLDGYRFSGTFQRALKEAGRRVLAFDDYGHAGQYWADLVLNQNLYATEQTYAARQAHTRLLLGPRYVLLRREFLEYRGWQRHMPAVASNVLVTLGGSDADNVTLKVLEALGRLLLEGLQIVIVAGANNPHWAALEAATRRYGPGIQLRGAVTDMPRLMARADLAVTAGGSTCWELLFMQCPLCVTVLADNQLAVAGVLGTRGVAVNLGWGVRASVDELAEEVGRLLADEPRRRRMAAAATGLIDGQGVERVVAAMMAEGENQDDG